MAAPKSPWNTPNNKGVYDVNGQLPDAMRNPPQPLKPSSRPTGLAAGIKDAEANPTYNSLDSQSADKERQELLDSIDRDLNDDSFFSGGPGRKKGFRSWSNRKKAAAGAGGLLGGGLLTIVFMISSGPLQFIHFAQVLQQFHLSGSDNFTDGRASKLIQYARTRDDPERRNLDYFGNKIADHYSVKLREEGIEFGYNSRTRISNVDINPESEAGKKALANLESEGFSITERVTTPNGERVRVELRGERANVRRAAISASVDALEMRGVSNAMATRIIKQRGGVSLHPLQNIARAADESVFSYVDKVLKQRSDYISNGVDTSLQVSSERPPPDPDGPDDPDPATTAATDDAVTQADDIITTDGTPSARGGALRTSIGAGVGVAGFMALTCGLQQIGNAAGEQQTANIVKPLMRTGMQIVAIGAQVQSGQGINLQELGALSTTLRDPETNTSWTQAESINAEFGKTNVGVPMDPAAVPGTTKPLFFDQLDSVIAAVPGFSTACDAVNSSAGNIFLTASSIFVGATGPVSIALNVGSEVFQQYLTNTYMDSFIRWIAGEQISTDVAGAMLGNYANYGAFLANNDKMFSLGGGPLTPSESSALDASRAEDRERELQQKSLYARMFDLKEPNSLAAKTLLENPTFSSTSSFASNIGQAPLRNVSSIMNNLAQSFLPRTMAAPSTQYDYGVPEIGYTEEETNSEIAEDPYENASFVEANLQRLNEEYGECFGTRIDSTTGRIETTDVASYIDRPAICDSGSEELLRFKYYLADMTIAQSLTCYAGNDEESCSNIGFENEASDDTVTPDLPGDVVGIDEIEDIPPWLALGRGCHMSIAARTRQMLKAAQDDGVILSGACWRSSEEQIRLRQQNCPDPVNSPASDCSPPTAKPGSSNHERGLAIDFSDCPRGSSCFTWLSENAAAYGFFNLPSESWHWSVDGS